MSDELPSSTAKKGGANQSSADVAKNQRQDNPGNERRPRTRQPPRKRFGLTKAKWREFAAIVLLIPWVWNDFIDAHIFLRLCLLAVTLAIAQGVACSFWGGNWKAISIWLSSLIPIAIIVFVNSQPESVKKFTVSLQVDGSSPVILTNDYLRSGDIENLRTNSTTKQLLFNSAAQACVIVPEDPAKTNIVLTFTVENDSDVIVSDLMMFLGVPQNWNIGLDETKWNKTGAHFLTKGWEIEWKGIQYWAGDVKMNLFPTDEIFFSVTNFDVPWYTKPGNKTGYFQFSLRSAGYEQEIQANLLVVPKAPYFLKPVVCPLVKKGTNGLWFPFITQEDFLKSQQ